MTIRRTRDAAPSKALFKNQRIRRNQKPVGKGRSENRNDWPRGWRTPR